MTVTAPPPARVGDARAGGVTTRSSAPPVAAPRRRARARSRGDVPPRRLAALCEVRIQGLPAPEAYGGGAADVVTTILALEALGYGCTDNGLVFAVNAHMWTSVVPLWLSAPRSSERRGCRDGDAFFVAYLLTHRIVNAVLSYCPTVEIPGAGSDWNTRWSRPTPTRATAITPSTGSCIPTPGESPLRLEPDSGHHFLKVDLLLHIAGCQSLRARGLPAWKCFRGSHVRRRHDL